MTIILATIGGIVLGVIGAFLWVAWYMRDFMG